jgi:hypothetical protein
MACAVPSLCSQNWAATGWLPRLAALALSLFPIHLYGQTEAGAAEIETVTPTVQVQVVVVGQEVPPRYETKRVKVQEIRRPRGEGGSAEDDVALPEQIHEQAPLQIAPEPDELPPGPLFIKNGENWETVPTRANNPTPKVTITRTATVVIATKEEVVDGDGKVQERYTMIAELPMGEQQESVLVLLVKDPRQHLKWKINRTLAFDTSRKVMPPGSFNLINVAGLPVRAAVADQVIPNVQSFHHASKPAKTDADGVVTYLLEIQSPDGQWTKVVQTGITMVPDGRIILIPYSVVLPLSGRHASVVTIRDEPRRMEFAIGKNAPSD